MWEGKEGEKQKERIKKKKKGSYNISKRCTFFRATGPSLAIQMRDHMIQGVAIIARVGMVISLCGILAVIIRIGIERDKCDSTNGHKHTQNLKSYSCRKQKSKINKNGKGFDYSVLVLPQPKCLKLNNFIHFLDIRSQP